MCTDTFRYHMHISAAVVHVDIQQNIISEYKYFARGRFLGMLFTMLEMYIVFMEGLHTFPILP